MYRWNSCTDKVADMRHQLINSYFALSNVLSGLSLFVPSGNQVALQMYRVYPDIGISNLEPCKCKPSRRINSFHRFPLFRPSRLCLKSRENRYLLSAEAALKRFLECRTNFYVICARFDSISETTTRVIVTY